MMKWFRRYRGIRKEIVELTETQDRQLEEWDAVKQSVNGTRTAKDHTALADYEQAEKQRLGEDSRIG